MIQFKIINRRTTGNKNEVKEKWQIAAKMTSKVVRYCFGDLNLVPLSTFYKNLNYGDIL
jgi:hypothetical protein